MTGLVVMGFFALFLFFAMLGSISTAKSARVVEKHSILKIELTGTLSERIEENPLAEVFGIDQLQQQGLNTLLSALNKAATDNNIDGIYLEGGTLAADYASAQELRKAIVDFKKSKKFVIAYGEQFSQLAYYIATAADTVLLNPSGMVDLHGIASEPIFYKELLDKVGVKMQVFRVGTYKSAVEPFIATEMSPANREQITSFCTDIWSFIGQDIAAARKIDTTRLNQIINDYVLLADAKDLVENHLVDGLLYADQLRDRLRALTTHDKVVFASPSDLLSDTDELSARSSAHIAIYYAEGEIVDQRTTSGFSNTSEIVGSDVVKDLDELANDDNVKAVVLRVNSPGGSAYASEQMWRAVQVLREKKPVVVSMGGLAASGGYYLSCGADYIISEPTTLTGSIGIFGLIPDVSGLLTEKIGLHFDVVKTHEASDMGAMRRGFNAGESAALQAYVERGYGLFLSRVAEGRKKSTQQIDSIAQGRVWTGHQALSIGLVDKLGTLADAVAEATRRAKMENLATVGYPAAKSWIEKLANVSENSFLENQLRAALGIYYRPLRFAYSIEGRDMLQARLPFEPNVR